MGELPVVEDRESNKLAGSLARRDVMSSLHLEILKRQKLRAKFVHKDDSQERADYVELPRGSELTRVPCLPGRKTVGPAATQSAWRSQRTQQGKAASTERPSADGVCGRSG